MADAIPQCLRRTFDLVGAAPNRAADTVLVSVLPDLDEPLRALTLSKLFARNDAGALSLLVRGFKKYDRHLRSLVLGRVRDLFEATRLTINSESADARLGAIDFIETSRSCRMAYLLSAALNRRCPRTVEAASHALTTLTRMVRDRRASPQRTQERARLSGDMQQLGEALNHALDGWHGHHRNEILVAAMMMSDVTEPALFKKASQTRSHMARAIAGVLRAEPSPHTAGFALRALRHPDLRKAAADKINNTNNPEFVRCLLDEVWVTADPEAARACSAIRKSAWLDDSHKTFANFDYPRAAAAARLVSLSGLPQDQKMRLYARWISSPSAPLREAAAWQMASIQTPEATASLESLLTSNDETLSTIGCLELTRRDPARFPGPALQYRRKRVKFNRNESFLDQVETYWGGFDALPPAEQKQTGQRLRRRDSERFDRIIEGKLAKPDAVQRIQALRVIRATEAARAFGERLYPLSHDPDERVRSLVVSILSDVEGVTAVRILRRALYDPDPRVQANAIDVISEDDVDRWKRELESKLDGMHHRVRANAVRILLRKRQRAAAETLLHMLADASPEHRISALWVVRELGLTTLMPRVREMAQKDSDAGVRERAADLVAGDSLMATFADVPELDP